MKPEQHVTYFAGETPCDSSGRALSKVLNSSGHQVLAPGIEVDHMFSTKPRSGYSDYHEKMTTHVRVLAAQAQVIDPEATARTFPVIASEEKDSVFHYVDTATSRAGIGEATAKLKVGPIAIVGLGGTGSYVLDLMAKTPVQQIHLFDGDHFAQHNAFRSPGAPSVEELEALPKKVDYFAKLYSSMRREIVPHDCYLDGTNLDLLEGMSFVFIALDQNEPKRAIIEKLEAESVPFVDVGMGVREETGSLSGLVRVTTSTPEHRSHVRGKRRISFASGGGGGEYERNIQIADLNALNASLAVLRWKKLLGFYSDLGGEHNSVFATSDACMINEDAA